MTMNELVAEWYNADETQPPRRPGDLWTDVDEFIRTGDPAAADEPFAGGTWNRDDVFDAVWTYWDEREKRATGERPTPTTAEIIASASAYAEAKAQAFRFMVSELVYGPILLSLQSAYIEGYRDRLGHERAELRAERAALEAKHD